MQLDRLETRTVILSAGPGAGKTTLLRQWLRDTPQEAHYLALMPEDGDPEFFRRRLLRCVPALVAPYEESRAQLPRSPWGVHLALAVAETAPDILFAFDDWHRIEDSPLASELQPFFRNLPPTATLWIASRHQPPSLDREAPALLAADHPVWQERPQVHDLQALPESLLKKALVMFLVGEDEPAADGWELVRRNIAQETLEGAHELRPAWKEAAKSALTHSLPGDLWLQVEKGLASYYRRHRWASKRRRLESILFQIPPEIRKERSGLLYLAGLGLLDNGQLDLARNYFLDALNRRQNQETPPVDILLALFDIDYQQGRGETSKYVKELESLESDLNEVQHAAFRYLRGAQLYYAGKTERAKELFGSLQELTVSGDRELAFWQCLGLFFLEELADRELLTATLDNRYRLVAIAEQYQLHQKLLKAYTVRLGLLAENELGQCPLAPHLAIPGEAFLEADPHSLMNYLFNLLKRPYCLKEPEVGHRFASYFNLVANSHNLIYYVELTKLFAINYQDLATAEQAYQEVASGKYQTLARFAKLHMAKRYLRIHQLEAAERLLTHEETTHTEELRLHRFLLGVLRHLQGDPSGLSEIMQLLPHPSESIFLKNNAHLLSEIGLVTPPPLYHVHAFGDLTFKRVGGPEPNWPRQKGLALLGLLTLHPEGLSSEALTQALFDNDEQGDPSASFHKVASILRHALRTQGAEDLLISRRGHYRLDWAQIAYCDLHEFDAYYKKAQELEAQAIQGPAAMFYQLALLMAVAPLFGNLQGMFEEEREAYEEKIEYAERFAQRYGMHLAR